MGRVCGHLGVWVFGWGLLGVECGFLELRLELWLGFLIKIIPRSLHREQKSKYSSPRLLCVRMEVGENIK